MINNKKMIKLIIHKNNKLKINPQVKIYLKEMMLNKLDMLQIK